MKFILSLLAATAVIAVLAVTAAPPGAGPSNPPANPGAPVAAPAAADAAAEAARRLLDAQYAAEVNRPAPTFGTAAVPAGPANSAATPAPGRTLPAPLNAVPVMPLAQVPAPGPAPAPGQVAPPTTTGTTAAPGRTAPTNLATVTNLATPTNLTGTSAVAGAASPTNRPPFRFPANVPRIAAPVAPGAVGATPRTNLTATPVTPGAQGNPPGTAPAPGQVAPVAADPTTAGVPVPDQNEILPIGFIKFSEADISSVLEVYQELTGRTVLKPTSLPQAKISIRTQSPLTRAEAVHALDSILSMNGISMVPQGDKFVKSVAANDSGPAAGKPYTGSVTNLPEAGVFVTYMLRMKNAQATDLVQILTPFSRAPNSILAIQTANMIVLRDYAENVKRMVEIIEHVDIVPQQQFESVVIPIKYALARDIAEVLGSLTQGGSTTTVGGQSGGGAGGLSGSGGLRGGGLGGYGGGMGGLGGMGGYGGGYGGRPGYGGYGQYQVGTATPVGSTAPSSARTGFQQRLQNIVNRASGSQDDIYVLNQTKIIADERINALLIFASKSDLATVSNIIDKIDVVLPQVLIEAVVLEVTLGNTLDYGFSYLQTQPSNVGDWLTGIGAINPSSLNVGNFGSNTVGGGFTYAAKIFDLDVAVNAIASDNRGKILQRPRIQTSHAREARLFVGQSRPYPTTSYYGGGAFGGYSSIQQLRIGVSLSVLPLVNADGLVVMEISQTLESVDGQVFIQNVGNVPITSQKEANAYVAVRNGETIMLGGFISNEKSKSHGGVPILKDIPLLGNLFRSNSSSDARRELMVMIRPTVLPTPESAATFASEERTRLPGTKEAEQDFTDSERKLLEDTNRRMEKKEGNRPRRR